MRSWLPLLLMLSCACLAMGCEDDPRDVNGTTSGDGDSGDGDSGDGDASPDAGMGTE